MRNAAISSAAADDRRRRRRKPRRYRLLIISSSAAPAGASLHHCRIVAAPGRCLPTAWMPPSKVQQMDINLETGFLGFGVFVATMQIKAAKIWLQIPLYDRLWF
uniref:Uncharacterized protein n=1 Tax=Oryza meridionalis TaxID=40149 RepID=A0A0E0EWP8_9ORYZ